MFTGLSDSLRKNSQAVLLPEQFICPRCKREGTLRTKVAIRHDAPLSPPAKYDISLAGALGSHIEKIYCSAPCDFSIDMTAIRLVILTQPSCDDCKLSSECGTAGAEIYSLSAYLCGDFRWKTGG